MEKRVVAQEFRLTDKSGNVRAKLFISPDGEPVLEGFDAHGELVSRTNLSTGKSVSHLTKSSAGRKENIFEYQERIEREVAQTEPKTTVGGHKLFLDFQQNETEASARYLNEVLVVSSEILEVQIRDYGDISVGLKGLSSFTPEVICYFSDKHRDRVAQLKPGMKIKLKGKCTEFVNGRVKLWGCAPGH